MKTIEACACGIARADCEYHRPRWYEEYGFEPRPVSHQTWTYDGFAWRRGHVVRRSDGTVREETDAEFRARILRGDAKTPGLSGRPPTYVDE